MNTYILQKDLPCIPIGTEFIKDSTGYYYIPEYKLYDLRLPFHVVENTPDWFKVVPDLDKPPLGLMPKYLHDEKRFEDIRNAMDRCACAGKVVPQEWIEERKELLEKIKFKEEEATKKYTEKELLEAEEKAFNAAKEIVVVPVIDNIKKWKEMQIRDENYKTFSDYKNGISQGTLMIDKIKSFIRGKV